MSRTVWRLNGSTNKVIDCCVTQTLSSAHALVVLLGHETFLHETYPDEASAVRRAIQIREGLLKGGGWTSAELVTGEMPTGAVTNAP
jgi:hypothetical protein